MQTEAAADDRRDRHRLAGAGPQERLYIINDRTLGLGDVGPAAERPLERRHLCGRPGGRSDRAFWRRVPTRVFAAKGSGEGECSYVPRHTHHLTGKRTCARKAVCDGPKSGKTGKDRGECPNVHGIPPRRRSSRTTSGRCCGGGAGESAGTASMCLICTHKTFTRQGHFQSLD